MGLCAPFHVAPRLFCAPLHPLHARGRRYPSALRRGGTHTHVAPACKAEGHWGLAPVACPCGAPTGEEGGASARLPVHASVFVMQTWGVGGTATGCGVPSSLTRGLPFARWPCVQTGGACAASGCVSPLRVNQGRGAAALLLVSHAWPSACASSSERGRGRGKGGRGPPSHSRRVARSRGTPPVLATPSNIPPPTGFVCTTPVRVGRRGGQAGEGEFTRQGGGKGPRKGEGAGEVAEGGCKGGDRLGAREEAGGGGTRGGGQEDGGRWGCKQRRRKTHASDC
ncbi:hypothetical protein EDB85DRAFT_2222768 [Lactarius pseudohatsudake]|nr:hypothetical protein EDB85DRAFT_2222768 [Lactarius pseudohatsudake]